MLMALVFSFLHWLSGKYNCYHQLQSTHFPGEETQAERAEGLFVSTVSPEVLVDSAWTLVPISAPRG